VFNRVQKCESHTWTKEESISLLCFYRCHNRKSGFAREGHQNLKSFLARQRIFVTNAYQKRLTRYLPNMTSRMLSVVSSMSLSSSSGERLMSGWLQKWFGIHVFSLQMSSDIVSSLQMFTKCFQICFDDSVGLLFVKYMFIGYYLAVLMKRMVNTYIRSSRQINYVSFKDFFFIRGKYCAWPPL
jgi:hypothetical protein